MIETGSFSLSGAFDPDDITRQLEIEPTWFARIGDPGPTDAKGPRKGAEWYLSCYVEGCGDEGDYAEIEFQIAVLVNKLRSKSAIVADLSDKFRGSFNLVAYIDGRFPGFSLPPDRIRDLAKLNVDIDCRYIYASDTEEKEAEHAN